MLIFIDAPLSGEQEAGIRSISPEVQVIRGDELENSARAKSLKEAEVIYTTDADFLPADVPRLRWIQLNTAAVDRVLAKPIASGSIPIANVSGAYSVAVAEFVMGMLLALTRRIALSARFQTSQEWPEDFSLFCGEDLHGRTMGLIGYGSIGRQIARLAQAFGIRVFAYKRNPSKRNDSTYCIAGTGDPEGKIPDAWFGPSDLASMLKQCDIAVITLPLTSTTRALVGRKELEALPPHAWLLNVGRGPIIDEAALVSSLQARKFAGAALDVFETEPLPPDNPLWKLPNVLITPHIASWTQVQAERAAEVLIENVSRDLKGEPLVNVVDKNAMY